MSNFQTLNNKHENGFMVENDFDTQSNDLKETFYCNFSNKEIEGAAKKFLEYKENTRELIKKIFLFVREQVIFGGDRWKVKASETLNKGYGACYNKNLLLIAMLRYHGIPSQLCANPMAKDFNKEAIGIAHIAMSTPYYHCFTKVQIDEAWVDIDPTLDEKTYKTFFEPMNIDWNVDWDGYSNMQLYKNESVIGDPTIYTDIDSNLNKNLNSHFLMKNEPEFIISLWMSLGNSMMWKQKGK